MNVAKKLVHTLIQHLGFSKLQETNKERHTMPKVFCTHSCFIFSYAILWTPDEHFINHLKNLGHLNEKIRTCVSLEKHKDSISKEYLSVPEVSLPCKGEATSSFSVMDCHPEESLLSCLLAVPYQT